MPHPISRREWLLGASALAARAAAPARPNILFLMVDEMRADALGCAGHPVVRTPHLDRLAGAGLRFAHAYTVSPVCSPSRASAFSGRYAHVHGVTMNQVPAHNGEIFLPSILKHYGYHTAISGKLHYVPRRFDFGFDQFWSFTAEGPTPELGYQAYLKRKYGSPAKFPILPGTCPWPDDPLGRDVGVFKYPQADFETEWITERALEYLRSRARNPQPWFLFTSYLKPHSPSVLPKKYLEMYDPNGVPVPKLPANIHQLRAAQRGRGKRKFVEDERMMRVMTATYYGAITQVDENIGRLLAELDRLGMADNTLVLFTADHGNMLGDHGRWFKGVMYEGSSHVPLLWRAPKVGQVPDLPSRAGRVEARLIENIDLLPSILEAAGIPVPEGVQGKSFLALAREGDARWKDRCYAQLRSSMVRSPEWKFIDNSLTLQGPFELYNMHNDPKEERNLAEEGKHRGLAAEFKQQLARFRAERPAPVRIPGMALPAYATISEKERKELVESAPDNQPQ